MKAMLQDVRYALRQLRKSPAVLSPIATMEEQLSAQLSPRRFQTWILNLFSLAALGLAAVGIFGVMHQSVVQRTQEIAIRAALGAAPAGILRFVLGQGARRALGGIVIGICLARALMRFMASLLFGVRPTDFATCAGVSALLAIVALFACYLPAKRAAQVDPNAALRYE